MKDIEYLLLDLGGVLYGVDYGRTLEKLGLSGRELAALMQDPILVAYEKGEIPTETFLEAWQTRFSHLSQEALQEAWNAMLLGPIPQTEKIIQTLSAHYPLALLSNTNDLHLTIVEPQIAPWKPYFIETFFSNRLKKRKPEPETYLHVLRELGWPVEKTLFVDDSATNIAGASRAGLKTYLISPNSPERLLKLIPAASSPAK